MLIIGYNYLDELDILNNYNLSKIKYIKLRDRIVISENVETYLEIPYNSIFYTLIKKAIRKKYLLKWLGKNYYFDSNNQIKEFLSTKIDLTNYKNLDYIEPYEIIDLSNNNKTDYYLKKINNELVYLQLLSNTKGNMLAEIKCPICKESFLSDVGQDEVFNTKCVHCNSELQVTTKEYKIIKIKGEL